MSYREYPLFVPVSHTSICTIVSAELLAEKEVGLRCDCVHIRIGSEGSISIERVRFRILIKEFFLFLGTNKLLFIEIDGINGQLSLAILQRFQQLKSKYAKGGPDTEERSSPREPHQTDITSTPNVFALARHVDVCIRRVNFQLGNDAFAVVVIWESISMSVVDISIERNNGNLQIHLRGLKLRFLSKPELRVNEKLIGINEEVDFLSLDSSTLILRIQLIGTHSILGVQLAASDAKSSQCTVQITETFVKALQVEKYKWISHRNDKEKKNDGIETKLPSLEILDVNFVGKFTTQRITTPRNGDYHNDALQLMLDAKRVELMKAPSVDHNHGQTDVISMTNELQEVRLDFISKTGTHNILLVQKTHLHAIIGSGCTNGINGTIEKFSLIIEPFFNDIISIGIMLQATWYQKQVELINPDPSIAEKCSPKLSNTAWKLDCKICTAEVRIVAGRKDEHKENERTTCFEGLTMFAFDLDIHTNKRNSFRKDERHVEQIIHFYRIQLEVTTKSFDEWISYTIVLYDTQMIRINNHQCLQSIHVHGHEIGSGLAMCTEISHILRRVSLEASSCFLCRKSNYSSEASISPFVEFSKISFIHETNVREQEDKAGEKALQISLHSHSAQIKLNCRDFERTLQEIATIKRLLHRICSLYFQSQSHESLSTTRMEETQQLMIEANMLSFEFVDMECVANSVLFKAHHLEFKTKKDSATQIQNVSTDTFEINWDDTFKVTTIEKLQLNRTELKDCRSVHVSPNVSLIVAKIHINVREEVKLPLMFIRMDYMFNHDVKQYLNTGTLQDLSRDTSVQIHLQFESLCVDLLDRNCANQIQVVSSIGLEDLQMRCVAYKGRQMTEWMRKMLSLTRKKKLEAQEESFLMSNFSSIDRLDGILTAKSLAMTLEQESWTASYRSSLAAPFLLIGDGNVRFSFSDIKWTTENAPEVLTSLLPRQTFFDTSIHFDTCSVHFAQRMRFSQLSKTIKIIQGSISTKQQDVEEKSSGVPMWMSRIFGNINLACTALLLTIPYPILNDPTNVVHDRILWIKLSQSQFTCLQLECFSISMDSLDVLLTEASTSCHEYSAAFSSGRIDTRDDFQLLYLPRTVLSVGVLWKPTQFDANTNEEQQLQIISTIQFTIKHRSLPESDGFGIGESEFTKPNTSFKVPYNTRAFLGANWDQVYPLLNYFFAGDSKEDAHEFTEVSMQSTKQNTLISSCAIQWNISVDLFQMVWWEGHQQDVAVLILLKDVSTQGIVKLCRDYGKNKKSAQGIADKASKAKLKSRLDLEYAASSLVVDILQCYLLQRGVDETAREEIDESAFGIPFEHTSVKNFTLETKGSSYRATYQNPALRKTGCGLDRDELLQNRDDLSLSPSLGQRLHLPYHVFSPEFKSVSVHPFIIEPVDAETSCCKNYSSCKSDMIAAGTAKDITWQLPLTVDHQIDISSIATGLHECSCQLNCTEDDEDIWPIQVESMKLHWTLKSRDAIFYMVAVIVDTFHEIKQRTNEMSEDRKSTSTKAVTLTSAESRNPEGDGNQHDSTKKREGKESLLELLQQGKLGLGEDDQTQRSRRDFQEEERKKLPSSPNMDLIAFKKYTIDIHNAQINVSDESSKSSILVASKHIHVSGGKDRLQGDVIASSAFEHVTVHVSPNDVDISAEPQWCRQHAVRQSNIFDNPESLRRSQANSSQKTSSSFVLRQVLEECDLNLTYIQTIATGAISVEANLSFLNLSTDRHQFFQLLNVVRHVLLAPPKFVHRGRRHRVNRTSVSAGSTESNSIEGTHHNTSASPGTVGKRFYAQLEEELRCRESKTLSKNLRTSPNALKCITFHALGGRFLLRGSPDTMASDHSDASLIELCLERINGAHTFYENQRTKLCINLHWLEINNLHSEPTSCQFEDVSSVMRAKLMLDNRFEARDKIPFADEKGMLTIRAESGPLMRIWGQKLRVQDLLEISIFPDIPYVIVIQLAADFYDLIYKFLFDHRGGQRDFSQNAESQQALFGRKVSQPSGTGSHATESIHTSPPASPKSKKAVSTLKSSNLVQRFSQHNNSSGSGMNSSRFRSRNTSASSTSATINAFAGHEGEPLTSSQEEDEVYPSSNEQELFYFKYVRIGNIRLCINCNGFFVNLSGLELDLPPYVCQGRLSTYKKMLQRFENHLKWHVTKLTASSGLSHFRNKLLKWTNPVTTAGTTPLPITTTGVMYRASKPLSLGEEKGGENAESSHRTSEDAKEQEKELDAQDDAHNAQVLFGPYYKPRKV
ncbi:unnamed protein product [Albugo candida]|uniref:Uncharacterized protein n=1 Tax=Albugo candida TaxID=65357 RepID=A0A024G0N5_9STRA|nr:unnamed protein product [Albugo candida]|eukprot:CCI40130.1 unnamed protein product [Albugo candida]